MPGISNPLPRPAPASPGTQGYPRRERHPSQRGLRRRALHKIPCAPCAGLGMSAQYLSTIGGESQANKTLPAGSVCVSCIGTIGVVSITTEPYQANQQTNSAALANDFRGVGRSEIRVESAGWVSRRDLAAAVMLPAPPTARKCFTWRSSMAELYRSPAAVPSFIAAGIFPDENRTSDALQPSAFLVTL